MCVSVYVCAPVAATFRRIQELSGARPLRVHAEDSAEQSQPGPPDGAGQGAGPVLYFGREFSLRCGTSGVTVSGALPCSRAHTLVALRLVTCDAWDGYPMA